MKKIEFQAHKTSQRARKFCNKVGSSSYICGGSLASKPFVVFVDDTFFTWGTVQLDSNSFKKFFVCPYAF